MISRGFLTALLLLISIYSSAQDLHILKPDGEIIGKGKFIKNQFLKNDIINQVESKESSAFTLDTLSYKNFGNFDTDFGFNSQDVALQYFQAPADMYIRGVGFSCSDDTGVQDSADISVRIIRLNWTWEKISSYMEEIYMGYYPSEGDGFNNADHFGENATGYWIDKTNGIYPLPPWTDNIDPASNSFSYEIWGDGGDGVKIIPEKQETAGNYQWLETHALGFEPEIRSGEIFAVVIKNNGYLLDSSRIGFWSSYDLSIPGWKYYENGRIDSLNPGWWIRNFTWDFAVAVDFVDGPRVVISNVSKLKTTTDSGPRTVKATITTDNPSGGEAGIQSAEILYSVDSGYTFQSIPMEYIGDQVYSADIPGQAPGTYVIYKVRATEINGYTFESVPYSYRIFEVVNSEMLVLFNGGYEGRAEQLTPYYLQDVFANTYDLWGGFGPVDEVLLNNYAVVLEIHSEYGPEDDNRAAIRAFVESRNRTLIVIGQEALGYLIGYQDSVFKPGDYEFDILGVLRSFNDVNYDTVFQTGQYKPSLVSAVAGTLYGDSLAKWISANDIDSLFYDPPDILGSENWMDQFIPLEDINSEVFMTGFSYSGIERPIAHSYTHESGSEITFFAFDPLTLNTDSVWIGNTSKNPLFQVLRNIVIPAVEKIDYEIPSEIKLYQNFPNPFNPSTVIRYQIPATKNTLSYAEVPQTFNNTYTNVSLRIYDILGREVAKLVDQKQRPGNYEVTFDAASLSSGIYIYKLTAGDLITARKMILLK